MLNILKNFDSAEKGKFETKSAETGSMKAILESIDRVEECGEMTTPASMSQPEKVRMNVNLSAEGSDAIADLLKLMGGHGGSEMPVKPMPGGASFDLDRDGADDMELALPKPKDSHDDMKKLIALSSDMDMEDEDVEEEWDNAPEEEYSDHKKMTQDLSGGLNRRKKQFKAAQPGDNAMATEAEELQVSIKEQLLQALAEKKKDDPCWKNYEMVGMKKKNGKEVPNCVPKKD